MRQKILVSFFCMLFSTIVLFFFTRGALFKLYVEFLIEKKQYYSLINLLEKQPADEWEPQWYLWYLEAQSAVLDSFQFHQLVQQLSREDRKALEGLGDYFKKQADWKRAYNYYQRGLSVSNSPSLQKKYQQIKIVFNGIQLLTQGKTCYYKGKLDSAEIYFDMALKIFEATNEKNLILKTKYNLILAREDMGKLTDAKNAYQQFLNELEGGNQTILKINVLNNLAIILKEEGDFPTARHYLLQALHLTKTQQDFEGQAMVWINIGNLAEYEGDYASAITAYNNTIQIAKQKGFTRILSEALWNVSMLQLNYGNLQDALRQMKHVFSIDIQQSDSIGLCYDYFGLGKIYWKMGLLDEALKYLNQSLRLQERINYMQLKSSTIAQIGMIYQKLGMFQQAEEKFLQALSIEEKYGTKNDQLQTLFQLAELNYNIKLYPEANYYLNRVRVLLSEIANVKEKYNWLFLKGSIALEVRQLDSAKLYFHNLVGSIKEDYHTDYRIKGMLGLGQIACYEQKRDSALVWGLQSARLAEKWSSYVQLFEVYNFLIDVYLELGQVEQAQKFFEKGIRLIRPYTIYASLTHTPEKLYVEMKIFFKKYIRFLIWNKNVKKAVSTYLDFRSLFVERSLEDMKFSQHDLEEIKKIHQKIVSVGQILNGSIDEDKKNLMKKRLRAYQAQFEEKWTTIRLHYLSKAQRQKAEVRLETYQKALSPYSVILIPVLFSDSLFYFCLTPRKVEVIRLPVSDMWVKKQATFLSLLIESDIYNNKTFNFKKHLKIYYQKIFEKIDHWLKQGGISSILFIADEWLYAIPINILFDGRQYLTQKYKIAYLANSSYIIGNERKKTNFYQFLGMAPLVEELPASSAEIQTAAQYIEGKKVVLLGNTATERIFKQLCSHSKIIHLATHGQFSSFQPEFSFLLFTGDQTNDGFFYLYELDSLNLSAVLVNISACRLVGRPLHNSSYQIQVGFGYKFLRSGATNVLLASFPLRDAFARHFSQIFYAQLKNHTIGTALQKTQQFFINRNISPSLWGSYIWLTNRINFMEQPILANTN